MMFKTDVNHDHSQSTLAPNQPSQADLNFGDSSEPLFSMYTKVAEDEDNKMVETWQKDADGILIFVSPCLKIHIVLHVNWNTLDWSILRLSCCAPCCDHPGPKAKQSGYLCILSWEHIWGSRRPERNKCFHRLPRRPTTSVLCSEICRLGEFTMVLEPGYER